MNIRLSLALAFAVTTLTAGAALAQTTPAPAPAAAPTPPTPDLVIAYNVGAQSDYIFRGLSQTNQHISGFAGIDATYKGQFYVGTWTSNVDFSQLAADPSTKEEVDLYGGWRPSAAGFNFDFGVQYYGYVDQPKHATVDYTEVYAKVTRSFGPLTAGASFYYSGEYSYHAGSGDYAELNASYTIDPKWTVSGAFGNAHFEKHTVDDSYNTWNLGVTYAVTPAVSLDLRYYDTDDHSFYGNAGKAHVVAALKATF